MFDAIVVGGSYAGMSAAMQVARARRKVLVLDTGARRNRFASSSHGFLGQDGRAPADIAQEARAQLLAYPNLSWIDGAALEAGRTEGGFVVRTDDGGTYRAKRLVLATGVTDTLPEIPGLADRWGKSVFHCPYCHGYELDNGQIGVLAIGEVSFHHAMMLPDWGTTTFFTNGTFEPDAEQTAKLVARGVAIEKERVTAISGRADVELADGRVVKVAGLFTAPHTSVTSPLAEQLGCAFDAGPVGSFIQTGMTKETSVAGVFACGDAARAAGSVALAVGDGAMAGAGVHQSLIFRD